MKKILCLATCLIPFFSFAGSMPSNVLQINGVKHVSFPGIGGGSFPVTIGTNLSISSKQGYAANIVSSENSITFYADRISTVTPVNWAQEQFSSLGIGWAGKNLVSNSTGNSAPLSLNFLLKGDLGFIYNGYNYVCSNVMFGQGLSGNNYPWWMFTNTNIQLQSEQYKSYEVVIECTNTSVTPNMDEYFYFKPTSNSSFSIDGQVNLSPTQPMHGTANKVCFNNMQLKDFTEPFVYATPGQTYTESRITVDSENNCFTVYANRQNSTNVVSWLKSQLKAINVDWAANNMTTLVVDNPDFGTGTPQKLNFAIQGNLSFTYNNQDYTCNNAMFGQGHDAANNNWWAFSNINSVSVTEKYAALECSNNSSGQSSVLFVAATNNDSVFKIEDSPESGGCSTRACAM